MKKKRKIIAEEYYVLLCNCGFDNFKTAMVCGIFASKAEAEECAEEVKGCGAKHKIKKCTATVEF